MSLCHTLPSSTFVGVGTCVTLQARTVCAVSFTAVVDGGCLLAELHFVNESPKMQEPRALILFATAWPFVYVHMHIHIAVRLGCGFINSVWVACLLYQDPLDTLFSCEILHVWSIRYVARCSAV